MGEENLKAQMDPESEVEGGGMNPGYCGREPGLRSVFTPCQANCVSLSLIPS